MQDPVLRLSLLTAACREPLYVSNDAPLTEAITLMQLHNYSQLPVTTNGLRGVCGYISWRTIATAQACGVKSGIVKDYKQPIDFTLKPDTPLLDAVEYVHREEFAFVKDCSGKVCGIVTTSDLSAQFLSTTRPFILVQEIERQLRGLLSGALAATGICADGRDPSRLRLGIDGLAFSEYITLMQDATTWERLALGTDKKLFLDTLNQVRDIRNRTMHFRPAPLSDEDISTLTAVSKMLRQMAEYRGRIK